MRRKDQRKNHFKNIPIGNKDFTREINTIENVVQENGYHSSMVGRCLRVD